jgi:hypothetical protein
MVQKALAVLLDKIVRTTLEWGQCLLLGWTIRAEPPLEGTNTFTKTCSQWDGTNSRSPITLPSAIAWVGREGVIHPSAVLLRAIATAVLDGTVRGCRIKVGTLLMAPEGELDETIHKLRPQNPLGIADLRQVNIDWSTLDDARKDIQSWVTKEVSGKEMSQHVSATGKRVDRDDSSSESDNKEDDTRMDTSSEEAGARSSIGGSPVMIEETASKAPRI